MFSTYFVLTDYNLIQKQTISTAALTISGLKSARHSYVHRYVLHIKYIYPCCVFFPRYCIESNAIQYFWNTPCCKLQSIRHSPEGSTWNSATEGDTPRRVSFVLRL